MASKHLPQAHNDLPWAISTHQLSKSYKQRGHAPVQAVTGLSLHVARGERFGVLGPNGAGKSTTLSMLAGLLTPTAGSANVAGFDVQQQPFEVKKRLGFIPQALALYPTLSARANLRYFGSIYGLQGKALEQRISAALDMVRLSERADHPIDTYSGGMKRRANIAASLLHDPEILFLDEPTVGVDPQSRNFIFDNVEHLNTQGMTIVYTSHYMEEVERLCERVAIIDQGELIALGSPQALVNQHGGGMVSLRLARALPEDVVGQLQARADVTAVQQIPEDVSTRVDLHSDTPAALVADVVRLLNERALEITNLELQQANLESVFLALTGKRLRE